ncbi:interleukin 12 receptor, beta 2a, like isoform X2 [Brienomyrus brachyistius]|uniref:interleukin 12 receptor, beta 2a, like isoform X2 n=1 Tax=Brienomyrus brachyistius TaxID=42636 RepID=UPI0020B2EBAB|nr:interleukin 12 receptor, beta 2a, like isoform X2 [Brienomyrus brachyistius]
MKGREMQVTRGESSPAPASGVIKSCVCGSPPGASPWQRRSASTQLTSPRAPEVLNHTLKPLEIIWKVPCSNMDSLHCEVQYRIQGEEGWIKGDEDAQETFLLEDVQPFSVYEFRVRCTCSHAAGAPSSGWSNSYMVQIAEAVPVGVLDMWIHCGESSDYADCNLVWKELPRHLARGEVTGYGLTVENETRGISAAELKPMEGILGTVTETRSRCCFYTLPLSLHKVTAVHLTAINSKGATEPTYLALPSPGKASDPPYNVSMFVNPEEHGRKLNVSWNLPSEVVDEYVLQLNELRTPPRFDWIKVNQSGYTVLEGDFRNYTPYNLSLFGISSNRRRFLAMTTVYTVEDVPPNVKRFQVSRLSSSEVTLTWQKIPVFESRGVILRYILGFTSEAAEYTVHRDLDSYSISGLQQGRSHMAWIRAETKAGKGARSTINFFIPASTDVLTVVLITVFLAVVLCLLWYWGQRSVSCFLLPTWCHDKVPDPNNSRLFKPDQNIGIWESLGSPESTQKMSCLEVVEREDFKGKDFPEEKDTPRVHLENEVEEEQISEDGEDAALAHSAVRNVEGDPGSGVNSYSEMNDREGAEVDGASLEGTSFPDYEKHFMPCPCDV